MNIRPLFIPALSALTITLLAAAPAWSAEYNLKKPSLKTGQKITSEESMTMTDAEMVFMVRGQTINGTMSMIERKVQEMRILSAKDGAATETETDSKEDSKKQSVSVNGAPAKETEKDGPLLGTTVLSKRVDGNWQNDLKGGAPTAEQEKALKKIHPFNGDEIYEDRAMEPGASWTVAPDRIAKMLGDSSVQDPTGSMNCKFERVEAVDGKPCAVISVDLTVTGVPEGQPGSSLTMELKGNIYRSLEDMMDVKVDFTGSMKLEGPIPNAPEGSTMKASGPMVMKATATISK